MKNTAAESIIIEVAKNNSSSIKVEELVSIAYHELKKNGINVVIVNDKGLDVDGEKNGWFESGTVWFQRDSKNDCWKAFQVIDRKNAWL